MKHSCSQYRLFTFLLGTLLLVATSVARAGSSTENAGTLLTLALPTVGLGAALVYEHDGEGAWQLGKSLGTTLVLTEVLKQVVHKERPDKSDNKSFPSGHTSVAFSSAAFIQKRYGWKWGVPAWVAASYVGYSRVQADKHFTSDVLAGAALGVASSYYFTSAYDAGLSVQPYVNSEGGGVQVRGRW